MWRKGWASSCQLRGDFSEQILIPDPMQCLVILCDRKFWRYLSLHFRCAECERNPAAQDQIDKIIYLVVALHPVKVRNNRDAPVGALMSLERKVVWIDAFRLIAGYVALYMYERIQRLFVFAF